MAGVPFDLLKALQTPETVAAARDLLIRREEMARAKANAERLLRSRDHGLSPEAFRALRLAVRSSGVPTLSEGPQPPGSTVYAMAANGVAIAELRLHETLERELGVA